MKHRKTLLLIDGIINLLLGVLLLIFTPGLIDFLGVPSASSSFYPNILGAVFVGIALALFIGVVGKRAEFTSGLGLLGAICINLFGGIVLLLWLLFGNLELPLRGQLFLWILDILLVMISSIELFIYLRGKKF